MREERAMAEQAVPADSPGRPEVPAACEAAAAAEPRAVTAAGSRAASPAGPGAGSPVSGGTTASIDDIIAWQEEVFVARQPESRRLAGRAGRALAGGVTSSWQTTRPQPVWLSHGKGSKIYDVDGNEYVDLHGGYGAALAGHGHPAIVEAIRGQAALGTHFAQPTPAAILVAEDLTRRFGLPLWRFANSGTEATMDAVHLMRAITGRDLIIKVEGCYHGHHDSVQVSVCPEAGEVGPPHKPAQVPASTGIPQAIMDLTLVVGFDEVKTGLTAGPGGATGLTGVTPDIVCLAKAIGGGVSVAAIGGTEETMGHVANGDYEMVGTFNGNPLAMAGLPGHALRGRDAR